MYTNSSLLFLVPTFFHLAHFSFSFVFVQMHNSYSRSCLTIDRDSSFHFLRQKIRDSLLFAIAIAARRAYAFSFPVFFVVKQQKPKRVPFRYKQFHVIQSILVFVSFFFLCFFICFYNIFLSFLCFPFIPAEIYSRFDKNRYRDAIRVLCQILTKTSSKTMRTF